MNILDLADRMLEGREMFSGKVAARGMVMGWRLELDMLTTQELEDRRKLPALEIVDTLLARAIDMAENTTASLDLETQLASLKLATTDETDALPSSHCHRGQHCVRAREYSRHAHEYS